MKPSAESAHTQRSLCALAAIVFISWSMHLPVSLFATASHDDALFISNAYHIVTGHWLGPFSQLTLAKGPGYSLFLAINALLGIPITLSIAILYAFACWVFVTALTGSGIPRVAATGLFLALLFQPALFPTRIIRDNIYPSLTLLTIAGVVFVGKNQPSAVKTALFGFILGSFWITREEGVWILPGIALYLLSTTVSSSKADGVRRHLLFNLGVYTLAAMIPSVAVSAMNYVKYGTFEVVDFKNGAFENTLRALNGVVVKDDIPYVPVSQLKRQLLYRVSPAFRQLEDYFEATGRAWTQPGCLIYPQTCGDYAGGWFMWALRDAVAGRGYYKTPLAAKAYYDEISAEIGMACRTGALTCKSGFLPFLPAISPGSLARIPASAVKALEVSLYQTPVPSIDETNNGYSLGAAEDLDRIRLFLGNPRSMPSVDEATIRLSGWYRSESEEWLALECSGNGRSGTYPIARESSPDIAAHFHDSTASAQRFSLLVKKSDNCSLAPENHRAALAVAELMTKADPRTSLGDGVLNIDERDSGEAVYATPLAAKQGLAAIYRWITTPIAAVGLACYFTYLGFSMVKKRAPGNLFWIASMLWLLYLSRLVLIILVDVSSFPATNYLYLAPALPILFAAATVSVWGIVTASQRAAGITH